MKIYYEEKGILDRGENTVLMTPIMCIPVDFNHSVV